MIRHVIALLVVLGLCLQGPATLAFEPAHCPMEESMQASSASGESDPPGLPDCCNDLATYDATGQACKSGADCGLPGAMAFFPPPGTALLDIGSQAPRKAEFSVRAAPIASPWRPPSLI